MPNEVLTCQECSKDWSRERKRGIKPSKCPTCRGVLSPSNSKKGSTQDDPQEISRRAAEARTEPLRTVPDELLDVLTGDEALDDELRRKLEFIADEVVRPHLDLSDVRLMEETATFYIRQFRRRQGHLTAAA